MAELLIGGTIDATPRQPEALNFYKKSGRIIKVRTVQQTLDGEGVGKM